MSDFEVIDIGEHNRLKQELAEVKAELAAIKTTAAKFYIWSKSFEELPERKSLGERMHWGDE